MLSDCNSAALVEDGLLLRYRTGANDLVPLAQQIETTGRVQLGNFPQAFSHIGLIGAAWAIDKAKSEQSSAKPSLEAP
jgi:GH15 family glucan-1,4-alpha-glucosidase